MQKILSYIAGIAAAITITGCASQFDIVGNSNLSVVDGRMMYLCVDDNDKHTDDQSIDSCMVEHGRFRFAGDMDSVVFAYVRLNNGISIPVVLEEAPISIRIDALGPTVEGGTLNKQLYAFLQKRDRLETEIQQEEQQFVHLLRHGEKDIEKCRERLEKRTLKLQQEIQKAEIKFVRDNYTNPLGPGYFMMLCNQQSNPVVTEQMRTIVESAPASFFTNTSVVSYLMAAGYQVPNKQKKVRKQKKK